MLCNKADRFNRTRGVRIEGVHEDNCERTSEGDGAERRIIVICRDERGGERSERTITILRTDNDLDEREIERIEREAERAARHAEHMTHDAERRAHSAARDAVQDVDRRVTIVTGGPGGVWVPGAPLPPFAPMLMMGGASEADLDGDGALSREEFRAQHQRIFDAYDANRDSRIESPRAVQPPPPPEPPTPPEPPRRR